MRQLTSRSISVSLVWFLVFCGCLEPLAARVIVVDTSGSGEFRSIPAAIDASAPGDEIIVLPGVYFGTLEISAHRVAIRSRDGAEETIIVATSSPDDDWVVLDGHSDTPPRDVVRFLPDAGHRSVLEGFTLTGGRDGVRTWTEWVEVCRQGEPGPWGIPGPRFCDLVSETRSARYGDGGLLVSGASPVIRDCVLSGNDGGAVVRCSEAARPLFEHCSILAETSDRSSGVRCAVGTAAEFVETTISGHMDGGVQGPAVLRRCFVKDNQSFAVSGARLVDCVIESNRSESTWTSRPLIRSCTIDHSTILWNRSGAASLISGSVIRNSIVWGNEAEVMLSETEAAYSCVQGAEGAFDRGNVEGPPGFCFWPVARTHVDSTEALRAALTRGPPMLTPESPCVGTAQYGENIGARFGVCDMGSSSLDVYLEPGDYPRVGELDLSFGVSLHGYLGDEALDDVDHPRLEGANLRGLETGRTLRGLSLRYSRTRPALTIFPGEAPEIRGCEFYSHRFGEVAVRCERGSSPTFERCSFRKNDTAIDSSGAAVRVEFCGFEANRHCALRASGEGASLHAQNCVFVGNDIVVQTQDGAFVEMRHATSFGSRFALLLERASRLTVQNSIFLENGRSVQSDPWSTLEASFCRFDDDVEGYFNTTALPLFVDVPFALRWSQDWEIRIPGDLRLLPDSTLIDAASSREAPSLDFAGVSRPQGARVDIGAYEFYEDCDESGVSDQDEIAARVVRDCNGNGVPDSCDLESGVLTDADEDGFADECLEFRRGDVNSDGAVDLTDATSILSWKFLGGAEPPCQATADVNGDADATLTDAIYILYFLYRGGDAPVAPFPDCGRLALGLDEELGCEIAPAYCP